MRTLRNNKQTIKYANLIGTVPTYVLDANGNRVVDFVDSDGVTYYQTTGEDTLLYGVVNDAKVNISFGSNEVQATEFGIDPTAYDATIVFLKNEYYITETSLVWFESEPKYVDGNVDGKSADYKVLMVKPSLNYTKILLGKLVK